MNDTVIDTSDIDSILEGTLDDLADMPEFKPFPEGAHKAVIRWETKKVKDKTAIFLHLKYIEPVELKDPTATPPANGDETSVMYQFINADGTNNEYAQGGFKKLMASMRTALNIEPTVKNGAVMEQTQNMECLVITNLRTDKKDKTKVYTGVEELAPI